MGWTTERKEILKRMWLAGDTSKQISDTLGEVSRNAVMGMVNRMGLMGSAEHNSRMGARTSGACRPKHALATVPAAEPSVVAENANDTPVAAVLNEDAMPAHMAEVATAPMRTATYVPAVSVSTEPEPEAPVGDVPAKVEETPPWDAARPRSIPEQVSEEILAPVAAVVDLEVVAPPAIVEAVVVEAVAVEVEVVKVAVVESPDIESLSDVPAASAVDNVPSQAGIPAPRQTGRAIDLGNAAPPPSRRRKEADRVQRSPESERRRLVGPLSGLRGPMVKPLPSRVKSQPEPVRVATDGSRPVDWRTALTLVEETTGFPYDPSRPGHRAALVAIGTVLARGDPRRVLTPFLSEPQIIAMMRCLAEKGIVVGGKTPQSWLEPDLGDMAFMIDMLVAEGVLDPKARNREMADAA